MARRGPVRGRCALCLRDEILTFEHFPPRAAGNKVPVVTSSIASFMASPGSFRASDIRGPKSQRGAGNYLLCAKCNNWLGRKLVPEYLTWSNLLMAVLRSDEGTLVTAMVDAVAEPSFVTIRFRGAFHPGRFARYALASCMLAAPRAASPPMKWQEQARAIVRDLDAQDIPEDFPDLVMSLSAGPLMRLAPTAASLRSGTVWHAEAIGVPWRFALATGPVGDQVVCLRASLSRPSNHRFFDMEIRRSIFGFCHTPLPGDRRSEAFHAALRGDASTPHPLCLGQDGESAMEVSLQASNPDGLTSLDLQVTVPGLWSQLPSHRAKAGGDPQGATA